MLKRYQCAKFKSALRTSLLMLSIFEICTLTRMPGDPQIVNMRSLPSERKIHYMHSGTGLLPILTREYRNKMILTRRRKRGMLCLSAMSKLVEIETAVEFLRIERAAGTLR